MSAPKLSDAQRRALRTLAATPGESWPAGGALNYATCVALEARGLVRGTWGAGSTGAYRPILRTVEITDAGRAALAEMSEVSR